MCALSSMHSRKLTLSFPISNLRVWEWVESSTGKLHHNQSIRWSNYSFKVVQLLKELISTLKNHMQVIVILLMQSGTTIVHVILEHLAVALHWIWQLWRMVLPVHMPQFSLWYLWSHLQRGCSSQPRSPSTLFQQGGGQGVHSPFEKRWACVQCTINSVTKQHYSFSSGSHNRC